MQTRINDAGYWEYLDPSTGAWKATHRRAAERKLGQLRDGFHVHHLDGDKTNNRHGNLVEVHPKPTFRRSIRSPPEFPWWFGGTGPRGG